MKSNLQKTIWANVEDHRLTSISGELPIQMKNSDATALPLVLLKEKKFGADIIRFEAGKRVALHTHEGDHILMVTKGSGTLTYGSETSSLETGVIYLVPGNTPHAIDAITELVIIAIGNDHREADKPERLELVSENLHLPKIINHEGFNVVRDDLLYGGTKRRALESVIGAITEDEIVCAVHTLGHSQLALAIVAQKVNKKVALFYAEKENDAEVFLQTRAYSNVTCHFLPEIQSQQRLNEVIKEYCKKNKSYYMPIGFDIESFSQEIVKTALALHIQPKEVWLLSGSGTLARALHRAWPHAQFNIVNMGFTKPTIPARVFNAREDTHDVALEKPPYPSSGYYDSKLWHFVKKYGSKGALVWNVASETNVE